MFIWRVTMTYQPRWVWSRKRQHFCRAFVNPQAYRMGSSRYSRLKPGVLHFLEAPESSRVISVEAPVIAKIPEKSEKYLIQLLCGIELSVLFLWYTSTQLLFASNHRLSPRTPRNNCNKQAVPALTLPPFDMCQGTPAPMRTVWLEHCNVLELTTIAWSR